jgi:LCP family protein required for cell wall assembly
MSLPRDTLVDAPAAPKMNFPGGRTKLNTAFALGAGTELDRVQGTRFLAERTRELTGITGFDGALLVDFYGFMEIVKAFDGIDVCVDAETESVHSGVVYHKGCSRMDAASALDYVRQRKSLAGGDFARQRHQQQFIKAIVKEATTSNVLTDPARLDQLVRAAGGSMTVCTGPLNPTEFLLAFRGIRADTISMIRTPAEHETDDQSRYLGEKLTPEAIEIFAALREERLDTFVAQHPDIVNE